MIKNYITMKKNEWKINSIIYSTIVALIDNQNDVFELIQKMYVALKDIPAEELQNELVGKLAEIVHEENTRKGN